MRRIHGNQLKPVAPVAERTFDGIVFDSLAEVRRYGELRLRMAAGEIRDVRYHPRLPMLINGQKIRRGYLELDFSYEEWVDGAWRKQYEDVKGGADTHLAAYKRDVCEAINDVKIKVISA